MEAPASDVESAVFGACFQRPLHSAWFSSTRMTTPRSRAHIRSIPLVLLGQEPFPALSPWARPSEQIIRFPLTPPLHSLSHSHRSSPWRSLRNVLLKSSSTPMAITRVIKNTACFHGSPPFFSRMSPSFSRQCTPKGVMRGHAPVSSYTRGRSELMRHVGVSALCKLLFRVGHGE